jgi:hypothetical protein
VFSEWDKQIAGNGTGVCSTLYSNIICFEENAKSWLEISKRIPLLAGIVFRHQQYWW